MKLHYDPTTDALYLRLADAKVDDQNRVVAIEMRNLQEQFPKRGHPERSYRC